ncbi:ketol-acid reductoisomerase [Sphingorhabdus soli]|uniref:Ketol-acid reductoisomerase n=1 Tax=Flavisphingopyxis soli TaxID=2601267 RepID=A0A5C6UB82_9SPHN|nr:ketol-acid reductoisomerase [Sphingorhabdus soli]TXC68988.1 ketol-acid reductoisomerase [Sphingorhabdus soli]
MPLTIHTDRDADPALLVGRRVAIIGYGNQGHAHALNLHDEGVDVVVGLRAGSGNIAAAKAAGLAVAEPAEAVASADLVSILAPDECHAAIYQEFVAPNLRAGGALCFAHGLSIRFGLVAPRADLDVILVAPKGPGSALRSNYVAGGGMPALFAIEQDHSGDARGIALAYGSALGCGRVAMLETSFAEEAEADLFNEQGVVWGAVPEIIQAGYDVLVEAGFSPEIAYFECITELKLLADLIAQRGIAGMREVISPTAEFAGVKGRGRIVTDASRAELRKILAEVRAGTLTRGLVAEAEAGYPLLSAARRDDRAKPIEAIGERLRDLAG